jgi:hypothetical protein
MSLATKASFGFMAQNEDDDVQRHHDMRWATITKLIDSEQKVIDVKMKLADSMLGNGLGDQFRMSVILMMDKIDKLNEKLALLKNEKRVSNPITQRSKYFQLYWKRHLVVDFLTTPTSKTGIVSNPL